MFFSYPHESIHFRPIITYVDQVENLEQENMIDKFGDYSTRFNTSTIAMKELPEKLQKLVTRTSDQ